MDQRIKYEGQNLKTLRGNTDDYFHNLCWEVFLNIKP